MVKDYTLFIERVTDLIAVPVGGNMYVCGWCEQPSLSGSSRSSLPASASASASSMSGVPLSNTSDLSQAALQGRRRFPIPTVYLKSPATHWRYEHQLNMAKYYTTQERILTDILIIQMVIYSQLISNKKKNQLCCSLLWTGLQYRDCDTECMNLIGGYKSLLYFWICQL